MTHEDGVIGVGKSIHRTSVGLKAMGKKLSIGADYDSEDGYESN